MTLSGLTTSEATEGGEVFNVVTRDATYDYDDEQKARL